MTTQLDTTGHVRIDEGSGNFWAASWHFLTPFTQGYVEAVLRAAEDTLGGFTICGVGFSDLAPETLARIIADCGASHSHWCLPHDAASGRRFWEMRQNPGNWNNSGTFPPLTVQLGDDGKVRFA